MPDSSFLLFAGFASFAGKRWNARDGMPGIKCLELNARKKEKDKVGVRCLSLLLSGVLVFVPVKFSTLVGFYNLIFLVLCHAGKERKCLH